MHSSILALTASLSLAAAVNRGFNYGAVTRDGAVKNEADFTAEFKAAKGLANTDGAFSSARLYTTVQSGTTSDPISAIPAAISTDTRLFLGLWASSGQASIDNEITALKTAISTYGDKFTGRINGISVGSEDMYRISKTGLENDPLGVGAQPSEIVKYIKQVKSVIAEAGLSIPVGHVDTWDVWQNGSNSAVVAEADFLGMNTFPYFQTKQNNAIANGPELFDEAYDITLAAANGKPVLITETGWPVAGKTSGLSEPSPENARSYYKAVGCDQLFGNIETYWYTLVDANTNNANQPQFGVVGTTLGTEPLYDLSCDAKSTSTKSPSASASATKSSTASATGYAYGNSTTADTTATGGYPAATGGVPKPSANVTSPATAPSTPAEYTSASSQLKAGAFVAMVAAAAAFLVM
ncbi:hypothetical protein PZA11_002138 [Diplocarpon coronariae]|uniref:Probable glucan endo-1,3-beta-glucosidase eglC n=1 Tax=Diplocarpon coronariae TaxID=2795749 RepID=A0A218Z5E4_9HELO|nr:GPI-anchored cell wall beta-1:3-endoglucanase EglC [Diplocarpon mali]OWP03311.1 hypothetical protein B2J93_7329 [Marssonina coronariae]